MIPPRRVQLAPVAPMKDAMKLYRVNVSLDVYVLARDENEACFVAHDNANEELMNGDGRCVPTLMSRTDPLPFGVASSLPWLPDDIDPNWPEATVAQWLASQPEES